jgi:polyphenol oxidase
MMLMIDPQPTDGFVWVQEPWGRALQCNSLPVPHLFTSRDLELRDDQSEWDAVAASLGVARERLLLIRQVHGIGVAVVRRGQSTRGGQSTQRGQSTPAQDAARYRPEADIIISDDPSVAIGVRVADCVPVLAFDTRTGTAGAAHAGWRGTAAGVAQRLVTTMHEASGSNPEDLVCVIGPSLGPCCGEVGEDVRAAFVEAGADEPSLARWFRPASPGKSHVDLWRANRDQLERAGVRRVHAAELCTKTHAARFHSYRAARERAGRMLAAIRPS